MDYKPNDIALMILATGENIMGKVVKTNQNIQTIELDQVVYIVPDQNGGVQPVPYLLFSEETGATFESDHVRHMLTPKEDIKKWYASIFEPQPKIITPANDIIIPKK